MAVVVTITVSGTMVETTVLDQPTRSANPTAIATTAPSVRTMAASARNERYTSSTNDIRKIPKSGMNLRVALLVSRSSQASSHGLPTRRMALNGLPAFSSGTRRASMAVSARLRSAGEPTRNSSAIPR